MNDFTKNNEAGRVVDLKKMLAKEKIPSAPIQKKKGGFLIIRLLGGVIALLAGIACLFGFFRKREKKHRVDFLRHFKNLEKKEDFIEREILKECLQEGDEEKKQSVLLSFFNFITRVLKLWWLPLFIIRFVWILFWRVAKLIIFRFKAGAPKIAKAPRGTRIIIGSAAGRSLPEEKKVSLESAARSGNFKIFWQALWSIPREVKNFLLGRTTEDYFYQRVLLEEMNRKKFRPIRHIFTFIFLLFLLILPLSALRLYNVFSVNDLRGRVLGASERAIGDLQSAAASASALDLKSASENFGAAKESFRQAGDDLSAVSDILFQLGKIAPSDKIRLAAASREITAAGAAAASLGNNLSLGLESFFSIQDRPLSAMIDDFISYEIAALSDAKKLNEEVSKIDSGALPAEYRGQFLKLKQSGLDLEIILSKNIDLVKKVNLFLGSESDKRYLFIFQNNSEMRASGGFIGSYALVDFSQGKIKNIEAPGGGSYDTEGGLKTAVVAPEPMHLVNPLWHFWDSNWWPDWKKSAEKLTWFYEKSGGPTTDGVIAFTPTVLERVLDVIGPVDMTDTHGVVMTSDNLWDNLRMIIENEKITDAKLPYDLAENKPKKIIGELMQRVMAELPKRLDRNSFTKLLSGLQADLSEKQILFYFKDSDLQQESEKRNWAGRLKETNKDYLMVVNTNIAGGKSDRKMEETISHKAQVQADGSVIDTVTITRVHTGVKEDFFSGMRNVNWMRIYVPMGSELLDASGFRGPDPIYFSLPDSSWQIDSDVAAEEGDNATIDRDHLNTKIYSEGGKTVFANWSMIDPGDTGVITLKYRLPFKLESLPEPKVEKRGLEAIIDKMVKVEDKNQSVYSLLVQKQPGAVFTSVNSELSLPADFRISWNYPENLFVKDRSWRVGGHLDSDKYWAVILEKIGKQAMK